jgi:D-3-phosphoglycerate dehydrogenase
MGGSLKAIARAGAGVNNIPIDRASETGIVVFNTPGANANAVKELAVCALVMASRDIAGGISWVQSLAGTEGVAAAVEKGKSAFTGPELKGKKLGVLGLGAIGAMVANAADALGMDVYGYDPFLSVDAAWGLSRDVKRASGQSFLFTDCDYISLHIPSNAENKKQMRDALQSAKPGLRIINMSRGDLFDDDALLAALSEGRVARYVTDFPNERLLSHKDIVAIPHLGASTPESEDNCALMAADQMRDYLCDGNIRNSVNFPTVYLPREKSHRLCVVHRNIPNTLLPILQPFADNNINVENMLNESKGDFAYTICECGAPLKPEALETLAQIPGILRIRLIGTA